MQTLAGEMTKTTEMLSLTQAQEFDFTESMVQMNLFNLTSI
jgi:hypothetical protein